MAIALPLIVNLLSPLQDAVEWLSGAPAKDRRSTSATPGEDADPLPAGGQGGSQTQVTSPARPQPGARPARTWRGPNRAPSERRGVRIVRVVDERAATGTQAGRMVISGRLVDVCAELDRLAAQEAVVSAG